MMTTSHVRCLLIALLTLTFVNFALSQQTQEELSVGVPVSREIAKGATHSYRITLASGQYVRLLVEQLGADVAIRIFHPDGRLMVEVDSPTGAQGPERLSAIAESQGVHRVDMRRINEDADGGRYELKLTDLRLASDADRSVVAGQAAYLEGDRARLARPAKRQEAIKKYEEAVTLYRAGGERSGEGSALTNIGVVYNQLGDRQKALDYLNQGLALHKLAGDQREQARTYNYMAFASSAMLERQKALEYFNQSLQLSRNIGDGVGEAGALQAISGIYSALGELQQALDYMQLALDKSKVVRDRNRQAWTLANIGGLHNLLGDGHQALEYFTQSLSIYEEIKDTYGEGVVLFSIGNVYVGFRDWPKALEYFTRALPITATQDDRRWTEAMVITSLGYTNYYLGNKQEALRYLNEALPIHKAVINRNWEAQTLVCLGTTYVSLGETEKALDYFNQALKLLRENASDRGEADALFKIARVERNRGNLSEARKNIDRALEIVDSMRARIVNQESRSSFVAARREYYEFYMDLLMRLDQQSPGKGHDAQALQESERARARSLLELLTESRIDIREGVDSQLLERERRLQQQINDEEMRRVRVLRGKHTPEDLAPIDKRVNQLMLDYYTVQSEIRIRSPRYAALTNPEPLTLRDIQQQVLDDKTMLLEYALGEERSFLWVVTQSELKSFELPKRSVVEAAARRVYDLLIASNRTQARRPAELALTELSRMVLGPAASLVKKERVLIVADGALEYVPFAALPLTSSQATGAYEPLIVRHEVVSLPSASVLSVLRKEMSNHQRAPEALAVLADAVFQSNDSRLPQRGGKAHASTTADQAAAQSPLMRSAEDVGVADFQRLPFSRREADAIVAKAAQPRTLKALDFTASRETVFNSRLDQYRIIHFATHGLLNSEHPTLSGIVLSLYDEQGRPIDGFVRLHEIYNLKLNAELVVLSACRTALGREIKGEGLVGLTRGFMYAGTPSVVASLWDVRDQATSELMSRFYEGMFKDGKRPAAALRAAQVSMWREQRWAAPYYWAGFVLQGEWK
ncbi:MAG TPA: CHAT domain-containing tetratricopeptide repeat protein [Pyrinomonadaceae bacterium]|nr:CHAT domain-containing tetratricopeptide repeat protein [Pyrinomonadaceae bacterium]